MRTSPVSSARRLVPALLLILATFSVTACDDTTEPEPTDDGLSFMIGDAEFSASGDLELDGGQLPSEDWAVAADPDSIGGIVVMAFRATVDEPGSGTLFVLQLRPARDGTFTPCSPDDECHGRLFIGWHTDYTGYDEWYEIVSGSVEVDELSASRIRGTFRFTLRDEGGAGSTTIEIADGAFDVPIDERAGGVICGIPPSQGCLTSD